MYLFKVIGGHQKDGRRKLKHHATFYVQQQPSVNTCNCYVYMNMITFGAQPNCSVSVSALILLYDQHL
jgi:hypothetical protein